MATSPEHISMALFCDFENVALGVRDANYDKFDIKPVLERLLLKGSIVVKKSYCDWERYKGFKSTMHEANFELIEIPHVRQSGKNSADIRLVVDALDLCYTKSHVNTFVIISGDSDFSPLVSKLRENAKHVIGVGVKNSTSDLLIANCDEFIFYDDLVRESERVAARREARNPRDGQPQQQQQRRSPEEERRRREELESRRTKGVEMAVETYDALVTDRDDGGKIWASVLKEALKRRNPGFNETYYGFRTFGNLLEEAQARGLLEFGRDEKSGAYVSRGTGQVMVAPVPAPAAPTPDRTERAERTDRAERTEEAPRQGAPGGQGGEKSESRRRGRGRGGRSGGRNNEGSTAEAMTHDQQDQQNLPEQEAAPAPAAAPVSAPPARIEPEPWYEPIDPEELAATTVAVPTVLAETEGSEPSADAKPARARRPRQPAAKSAPGKTAAKTATKTAAKRTPKAKAAPADKA